MQALGFALYEQIRHAPSGRPVDRDLLSYKVPTLFEKPEMVVEVFGEPDPTGPFGAKGVGEVAFPSVAPAIANALFDATGIRLRALPMTPERVLEALFGGKESRP